MRRKCSISEKGSDCTVEVYKPEEAVTVLRVGTHKGVAAPGLRAAKSSELEEGEK